MTERLSATQRTILTVLHDYVVADRAILQGECGVKDDARMREILRAMKAKGWIDRVQVTSECLVAPKPIMFPNEAGCAILAADTGDMRYLLDSKPPRTCYTHFAHFLGVTRTLLAMVKTLRAQGDVELVRFLTEHHYVRPGVMMLTEVGVGKKGGRMVCNPDFALVIRRGARCRVYFGEFETGADGSPTRVAAKKAPGYAAFIGQRKFKELFPEADDARVIAVTPNAGYRESMRRALKDKGGEHWILVTRDDLAGDFLHTPVFHSPMSEGPTPLVKSPPPPPAAQAQGGGVAGEARLVGSA